MPLCRLCSTDQKLIRAHVIPEAFFRVHRVHGEAPPVLLSNTQGHYPKRAPIGVYDEGILCRACEDKFQALDDNGASVLLNRFDDFFHPIEEHGHIVAYESSDVDQTQLLRFLVSVLWRASVSTHNFYRRVQLGPYESAAAAAINNPHQPVSRVFAAVLWRWRTTGENDGAANAMLDPSRERLLGINAYRLYLGRMVTVIKVSTQEFSSPLSTLALGSGPLLRILTRDFGKSKDLAAMVRTVTTADGKR